MQSSEAENSNGYPLGDATIHAHHGKGKFMRTLAFGAALAASSLIVTMGGAAAHADIGILNDKSI